MNIKVLKTFLRIALASAFLSAVADRFGLWPQEISSWGNWDAFISYTAVLNPWFPQSLVPVVGIVATVAEVVLAFALIIGVKTELSAQISGYLLLLFGLSMAITGGIKGPLDYSVFSASAAAFSLGFIKVKYLELDTVFT